MSTAFEHMINFKLKIYENSRAERKHFYKIKRKQIQSCSSIINLFQVYKMTLC